MAFGVRGSPGENVWSRAAVESSTEIASASALSTGENLVKEEEEEEEEEEKLEEEEEKIGKQEFAEKDLVQKMANGVSGVSGRSAIVGVESREDIASAWEGKATESIVPGRTGMRGSVLVEQGCTGMRGSVLVEQDCTGMRRSVLVEQGCTGMKGSVLVELGCTGICGSVLVEQGCTGK